MVKFDELPEHLQEEWWNAASLEYSQRPLDELRDDQLEALIWYYDRLMDGWEHESPQSYNEALMWHEEDNNLAQARLEQAKRRATRAAKGLQDWKDKKVSKAE